MTGIILCGGQSSRMGSDKGLLEQQEKTWAEAAADKIKSLGIPVKISVNKEQVDRYIALFHYSDLVIDNSSLSAKGPLLGVLSSYLQFPGEDLFILACDMPSMTTNLLGELYHLYESQLSYDVYIYTNNGEPEPLCGIYSANGLASIYKLLQSGQLTKYSMKFVLQQLHKKTIGLTAEQKQWFRNINTHSDLNGQ